MRIHLIAVAIIILTVTGCAQYNSMVNQTGNQSFTGSWNSSFGVVTLFQKGDKVAGSYTHDKGKIAGTVNNNVFTGTWAESPSYLPPKDSGEVEFTLSSDGKTWSGKWRYGSSGAWKTDWTGTRI